MTYAAEIATLRAPVVDNRADYPAVLWESEGDDPSRFPTGDRASPGKFLHWRCEYAPGEYLASGGGNQRWKHVDIDIRIAVEAIAGARAAEIITTIADLLVGDYDAGTGAVFRTPEADMTGEYAPADGWIARDWVCPVWIFTSA